MKDLRQVIAFFYYIGYIQEIQKASFTFPQFKPEFFNKELMIWASQLQVLSLLTI